MSKRTAWFLHASNLAVGATGLVFAWMLYFAEPEDPFAIVNHPWQPDVQHLHVLTAPLLVFGCGVIWISHVWRRIRSGFPVRRKTGILLAALLWPMIASGYLIQVAVDETLREVSVWVHVSTSIAWIALYLVHQFLKDAPKPKAS